MSVALILIYIYICMYIYIYINAKLGTSFMFAAGFRKTTENRLKHEIHEINILNSFRT